MPHMKTVCLHEGKEIVNKNTIDTCMPEETDGLADERRFRSKNTADKRNWHRYVTQVICYSPSCMYLLAILKPGILLSKIRRTERKKLEEPVRPRVASSTQPTVQGTPSLNSNQIKRSCVLFFFIRSSCKTFSDPSVHPFSQPSYP
jgi:hypothetical protein